MARPSFLCFLTTNQQQVEAQVLLETRFFPNYLLTHN